MNESHGDTPNYTLDTAVLFLVFNRLDTTTQVFEAIRQAKPPRVYFACDGARPTKDGEAEKVEEIRSYLLDNVDWPCEVFTLFQETNCGCQKAVSGAIDWFFSHEEKGIILEDDCLPTQSFFKYCEDMLELYKDDMRIWHIGGCNFQDGMKRGDADYYFSKYCHVWGWATWASRWEKYDVKLDNMKNSDFLNDTFNDDGVIEQWKKMFNIMKFNPIDTWDYQWVFATWFHGGMAITPQVNMISNIGFGEGATHTVYVNEFSNVARQEFFVHNHPTEIVVNEEADDFTYKHSYAPKSIPRRVLDKIFRLLKMKKLF